MIHRSASVLARSFARRVRCQSSRLCSSGTSMVSGDASASPEAHVRLRIYRSEDAGALGRITLCRERALNALDASERLSAVQNV